MIVYYVYDSGYHVSVFEIEITKETSKLYYVDYKNAKLVFGGGSFYNSRIDKGSLCFILETDAIWKARHIIEDKIERLRKEIERWQEYEGSF